MWRKYIYKGEPNPYEPYTDTEEKHYNYKQKK